MGLRVIEESTNKKWEKYKGLDTFTQKRLMEYKAKEFNMDKVNLNATGNELRIILEDMFAYPINDNSWEDIQFYITYNRWTLKEIIQVRELDFKQGNVMQIVSCNKNILNRINKMKNKN